MGSASLACVSLDASTVCREYPIFLDSFLIPVAVTTTSFRFLLLVATLICKSLPVTATILAGNADAGNNQFLTFIRFDGKFPIQTG